MMMLESFYGGYSRYQKEYEIYNVAGIHVLSASPRGSSGLGRDFAAMKDGELGGNEEIDMIRCAKFISDLLGIPASRVGRFGGYRTESMLQCG
jgi:dipeptidyl aminopeptidase/acylaminoacyl peptidase